MNIPVELTRTERFYLRKNILESDQSYLGFSTPVETEWWDLDTKSQSTANSKLGSF